jgi:ATP-binding cassette subfamily B protein
MYPMGYLIMFWSWTSDALGQVTGIAVLQRQIMGFYFSAKRYLDMLAAKSDVTMPEHPIHPSVFKGAIEFRNVTYRHNESSYLSEPSAKRDPALVDLSFTIRPGEVVGIVGESGAGKSSIVQALLRAQDPEAGEIYVDGHDLRSLDLRHLRESIGLVEQTVRLFDHSIRYNVAYGLNGRSDLITKDELDAVAREARLDGFLSRLERGFDTVIGEGGARFSGGERQRIGIARALIKQPPILIFDEATSNLDAENEAMIHQAIERALTGRTVIIIAHRFSTIRGVDRILVLDHGRLVAEGSHEELAATSDDYQRLLRHQVAGAKA